MFNCLLSIFWSQESSLSRIHRFVFLVALPPCAGAFRLALVLVIMLLKHSVISAAAARHPSLLSAATTHHLKAMRTVITPDNPPFLNTVKSSLSPAFDIGSGSFPISSVCRHLGWMLFHQASHSSEKAGQLSIGGTD